STTSSNDSSTPLYRVQVGVYKEKKKAEDALKKVKKAGFTDAVIKKV
ncbi:SPOR domain-containing protein, partial [Enterococcus faecalis]